MKKFKFNLQLTTGDKVPVDIDGKDIIHACAKLATKSIPITNGMESEKLPLKGATILDAPTCAGASYEWLKGKKLEVVKR